MSFDRFHSAQASRSVGYETALAEIRQGRKTSHWIWYIFPQLAGLGRSSTARVYGLRDLAETCAYLRDPLLRARYEEITGAVHQQLTCGVPVEQLMGSSIDALKLASSLTLFRTAATSLTSEGLELQAFVICCDAILGQTAAQGYPQCTQTLNYVTHRDSLDSFD